MKILNSWFAEISLRELALRVYGEAKEDRSLGRAAELGFYFVLSIFPLLIFLLTLLSFLPDADQLLMRYLSRIIPGQGLNLIKRWATDLKESRSGELLSFGILFALWSASNGMSALMDALNTAYEVKEGRSFWKARAMAILLVIALSSLVLGGAILVVFGKALFLWMAGRFGIDLFRNLAPNILRFISGLTMLYTGFLLIYSFGPNTAIKPQLINAGAIFALVLSVTVSYLFSLYLHFIPTMNATYGGIGAFIVLMLSLFLISLIIIIGAQINSEIEKARGEIQIAKE